MYKNRKSIDFGKKMGVLFEDACEKKNLFVAVSNMCIFFTFCSEFFFFSKDHILFR